MFGLQVIDVGLCCPYLSVGTLLSLHLHGSTSALSHLPSPMKTVSPLSRVPSTNICQAISKRGGVVQVEQPAPGNRSRLPGNALPGALSLGTPLFSQRRTGQVCLVLTGHGKGTRDDGDPMLFTVELQCSCQDERVDTIPWPPLALQPRNQVDVCAQSTQRMFA